MCKRETKNRTHTPLSQLPLHRLWDCLCVSPLFSFKVPVSPLPPSLFSHFHSSWISPSFVGQAHTTTNDLKRDTTSPDYAPLGAVAEQAAQTVCIPFFSSSWVWTQTLIIKNPSWIQKQAYLHYLPGFQTLFTCLWLRLRQQMPPSCYSELLWTKTNDSRHRNM